MVERITRFNLGKKGSELLDYIIANPYFFVLIAFIYGLISLYAKYNYRIFMPGKMEEIIVESPKDSFNQSFSKWKETKKELPWYVLVPTKNELWFRRLNQSNGVYQSMTEKESHTEKEMMQKIYQQERKTNNKNKKNTKNNKNKRNRNSAR